MPNQEEKETRVDQTTKTVVSIFIGFGQFEKGSLEGKSLSFDLAEYFQGMSKANWAVTPFHPFSPSAP